MVRWGNEEGVRWHKFLVKMWIAVKEIPFSHWNQNDLSKFFIKFEQILDISEPTLAKSDLSAARLYVGCDDIDSIPRELIVVIRSNSYSVTTKIRLSSWNQWK